MSNQKCQFCFTVNQADSRYCETCGNEITFVIPMDGFLPPGTVLRNSYVIEIVIGESEMGVVYSCHHKTMGTRYALKVLDAKLARMEILRNRFLFAAQIQATVVHPHIVRVMDVIDGDKDGGLPVVLAIVMEYIDGSALDEIIENHKLSICDAVSSALVILDAIGVAHHAGFVHHKLKLSNLMVSTREAQEAFHKGVKVMDFGIAKVLEENPKRTISGARMGAPRYMAPEQIDTARDVDARADIYAIGLTLYELICGRTPFEEYLGFDLLQAQISLPPPPMQQFRQYIGDHLEAIVMKALEKDPVNRYQSAEAFQRALLSLGGYDEIPLLLKPYDGVVVPSTKQKLQRKIGQAIDRSKTKLQFSKANLPFNETKLQFSKATQKQTNPSATRFIKPAKFKAEVQASATPDHRSILSISAQRAQANDETPSHSYRRRDISNDLKLRKKTKKSGWVPQRTTLKRKTETAAEARDQSLNRELALAVAEASFGKPRTRASARAKTRVQHKFKRPRAANTLGVNLDAPPEKRSPRPYFVPKLVFLIFVALAGFGLCYRHINKMPQPAVQIEVEIETPRDMAASDIPDDAIGDTR